MLGLPLKIDPEGSPHTLYEGIEYKEFWNGLQRRKLDELEHAIVRDLLPVSGRRIIDVGCGYGPLSTGNHARWFNVTTTSSI
jgi:2-polyprenyl-3-methyl-5-hydroxy-6-metoxy-1,4-benzoquinol methylase